KPQPLGPTEQIWGVALDEQAKEIFFRGSRSEIMAQSMDGETTRRGFGIELSGLVCILDNLGEELRIVLVNVENGSIFVTDSAFTEFTLLSSASEGVPDAETPIGDSFGATLDRVGGRRSEEHTSELQSRENL